MAKFLTRDWGQGACRKVEKSPLDMEGMSLGSRPQCATT